MQENTKKVHDVVTTFYLKKSEQFAGESDKRKWFLKKQEVV